MTKITPRRNAVRDVATPYKTCFVVGRLLFYFCTNLASLSQGSARQSQALHLLGLKWKNTLVGRPPPVGIPSDLDRLHYAKKAAVHSRKPCEKGLAWAAGAKILCQNYNQFHRVCPIPKTLECMRKRNSTLCKSVKIDG